MRTIYHRFYNFYWFNFCSISWIISFVLCLGIDFFYRMRIYTFMSVLCFETKSIKKTYSLLTACKVALVYFLPVDPVLKYSILILSGTPCASVILTLAEIHKSERESSANCILLSTLLCLITLPLLALLIH